MAKHVTVKQLSDFATGFAEKNVAQFANKTAFETTDSKVSTLIGSDTGKSARTIANEELAERLIPANAKEALDTLQEIAAWIQDHPDEAAAINAKLTLGTYDNEGTQTQYATVKAYVEAYVAAQQQAAALSEGNGIGIANNVVSAVVDQTSANGLSVGAGGLALAEATSSASGAMSASDKAKLDGFEEATDAEITAIVNGLYAA